MSKFRLEGNELFYDLWPVGRVHENIPASVRGRLEEALDEAQDQDVVEDEIDEAVKEAVAEERRHLENEIEDQRTKFVDFVDSVVEELGTYGGI